MIDPRFYKFLFPYQWRILRSDARFKILNCSRQCGKSTVFAFEAVFKCATRANQRWIALSRGERQVIEWIKRAKELADTICAQLPGVSFKANVSELIFSNGSRISGIPANPDTARGYSANLILDEFAYHDRAEEIWSAVFPMISNGLKGDFVLRIGSTVAGKNNMFWKLWEADNGFEKHKITVYDAVAQGMKIDIEALRSSIGDLDVWRQEYECVPVESTTTLISYDLLEQAVDEQRCSLDCAFSVLDSHGKQVFLGVDIGRKHDLTVIYVLERTPTGDLLTRAVHTMLHAEFSEQECAIADWLRVKGVKACAIDATGIGAQLAETLYKRFPAKVEPCTFSAPFKNDIYINMQRRFQEGAIKLPRSEQIREDIHAVQRIFTSSGNISFYAPSNEDGHSDIASALALALYAERESSSRSLGLQAVENEKLLRAQSTRKAFDSRVPSISTPRILNF